ncbi:hypothetical protein [Wolbachia endosymbiont of Psylliodes chrysocephala]|uniref:hypothetical protein n=1 Tax=Wolbachia endosymbiont of Psylliodes chrysocephala TaxID=2883236 RepID=UPI0020A02C62|nr:hypothetical protein [Wolbachia endosymbiont of Psylliodes chrysocephala]
MIGISQLQFPSKDSSKLKFASYFVNFVALSILVNPANAFLSFATIVLPKVNDKGIISYLSYNGV